MIFIFYFSNGALEKKNHICLQINGTGNNTIQSFVTNVSSFELKNDNNEISYSLNWFKYGFESIIKFSVSICLSWNLFEDDASV